MNTATKKPARQRRPKQAPPALRAVGTGLKIVLKCLLLLPLLAGMVWFNYTVDVSSLFQGEQYDLDIAKALIAGEALDNYDRMNEREVLALLAKNLEEPYEVLSFGSSRVLQLRKDTVGVDSFFNAGLSGADFVDMVGITYLFDRAEMNPKTLVLELDPWLLSAFSYNRHPLSDTNLYEEFLTLRLGIPTGYEPEDNKEKYKALFSPTYFQGNLKWYREEKEAYTSPTVFTVALSEQKHNIKLGDGSVLYEPDFRNMDALETERLAREQAAEFIWMENYPEPDPGLCEQFDDFVSYYRGQGVEVVFLLTPYHPIVYNYAQENAHLYTGFFLTEPWFAQYAREHNIPLYGSYNPFVCGLLEEHFFDGLHMHEEGLAEIFPTVPAIREEAEDGWAASPWFTGRVRVTEETAATMVRRRYEIPDVEDLRPMKPETHNGIMSHVFGWYDSTEEDATLKARYLVSQDDGVVYRFADDVGWVVDSRFEPAA